MTHRCTIRFIRSLNASDEKDDVLRVFEDPDSYDGYRITFKPVGVKKVAEFYLTTENTVDYIRTILKTLTHDAEPFHHIQVDTVIHPSIIYHVSDLNDYSIRDTVMDTIEDGLRHDVELVRE